MDLAIGNDVAVSEDAEAVETAAAELDPGASAELIEAGAAVIDVRREYEFEGGHLPGRRTSR